MNGGFCFGDAAVSPFWRAENGYRWSASPDRISDYRMADVDVIDMRAEYARGNCRYSANVWQLS